MGCKSDIGLTGTTACYKIRRMRLEFGFLFILLACSKPGLTKVDETGFAFGSYLRIEALAPTRTVAESAVQRVFAEMSRLDTLWSSFLPGSEVARINESKNGIVHAETRDLIDAALKFCASTGGALDITIQPLTEAWGFLGGEYRVPDSAELKKARGLVDYHRVLVRNDSVILMGRARLDLGAVAVGCAVDRAVEMLKAAGVKQGLVDAGGDIRVFGDRVWRIGLQNPRGKGIIRVLNVKNQAVSTSGDYQKFFEDDGKRYCHIIDPETGYPASRCASVTVIARSALVADAFSTAVFVLGPENGLKKVQAHESSAIVLVDIGDSLVTYKSGGIK